MSDSAVQSAVPAAPVGAPAAASGSGPASSINWGAIFFIVVGVIGLIWMIKSQSPQDQVGLGLGGGGGGGAMGAEGNPAGTMKAVQGQLKSLKAKLDKNPADVETLKEMYAMYAQVGRTEDIKPFLTKALASIESKPGDEASRQQIADLAEAAMSAEDNDGLVQCLTSFNKLFPEELGAMAYLGDVTFRIGKLDDSLGWYTKYLAAAKPETEGASYWDVQVSRGSTYIEQYKQDKNAETLSKGMADLEAATAKAPTSWNAWYYMGMALLASGDKSKAREAWVKAVANAGDEFQKWEAQAEIDKLDGKEPTPMPNPHGEGFGTTDGAGANPHGGGANPHAAGANPHGDMPAGS